MENESGFRWITYLLMLFFVGLACIGATAYFGAVAHDEIVTFVVGSLREVRPQLSLYEAEQVEMLLEHLPGESLRIVLVRDVGIAIVIAVILTFGIEGYARRRLQDEIRTGVVEAAFKRLIPPLVFAEVKTSVIGAKCVKRDWELAMHILSDVTDGAMSLPADTYVSRTTVSYKLWNVSASRYDQLVACNLDQDILGRDSGGQLPRFERVTIDGVTFEGEGLKAILKGEGMSYEIRKTLPPNESASIEVVNEVLELVRVPDTFVWSMNEQTEVARIKIESEIKGLKFEVKALHPDRKRMQEPVKGRNWMFPGAILPWQGFQIRSFRSGNLAQQPAVLTEEELVRGADLGENGNGADGNQPEVGN